MREILLVSLVVVGGIAFANVVRLRNRWINGTALFLGRGRRRLGRAQRAGGRISPTIRLTSASTVHSRPARLGHLVSF